MSTALVYGISRWSNPHRPAARHLDNGQGLPLCGGRGRKVSAWERDTGEPTCVACQSIAEAETVDARPEYLKQQREAWLQEAPDAEECPGCADFGEVLDRETESWVPCPECRGHEIERAGDDLVDVVGRARVDAGK
jgi:Zn finger protein HypA/HybF involved in hydrogenase expression